MTGESGNNVSSLSETTALIGTWRRRSCRAQTVAQSSQIHAIHVSLSINLAKCQFAR